MKTRSICALEHEARGLRDGSVTTLIRPVKPQPTFEAPFWKLAGAGWSDGVGSVPVMPGHSLARLCPFGPPGTRLAVREAWASGDTMYQQHENDVPSVIAYLADKSAYNFELSKKVGEIDLASWNWSTLKKRSPATMPAWAVRTHVTVASARVVRCTEIREDEAKAWGCEARKHMGAGGRVYGTLIPWLHILEGKWEQSFKRHPFASSWAWVVGVDL